MNVTEIPKHRGLAWAM